MTTSNQLGITEMAATQNSREVTVNEAIARLEQGAKLFNCLEVGLNTPPGSPAEGEMYIVGTSPTGAWVGHENDVANFYNGAWIYTNASEGMFADDASDGNTYRFNGTSWAVFSGTTVPGLSGKQVTVRVATTANITIATALNPGDTLEGETLAQDDLILVKDQTAAEENGIYVVDASPSRHPDFDTFADFPGLLAVVLEGTTQADTIWLCTSNPGGTINVDPLTFVLYSTDVGLTEVLPRRVFFAGQTLPTALASDQNNYDLGNNASVVIFTTSGASRTITGFQGGKGGRTIFAWNGNAIGGDDVILADEDGASDAKNRFSFSDGDLTLAPRQGVFLQWAIDYKRWLAIGGAAAGGGFTAASATEVLTGTETTKGVTPDSLAALWEKGSDVASAATVSLGEGKLFHITGTTTITDIDFAVPKDGRMAILIFDGVLTLTHNATTLQLPGGSNITTAAGDRALIVQDSSDNIIVVLYQRAASLGGSSSVGKHTIWVPASAMILATTSPPASSQIETGTVNLAVLDFDASADEIAHFNIAFPKSWNEGTITFRVKWTTAATDTDGVAWALEAVAVSDNDAINASWGTAVVVADDAQGAALEMLVTAESSALTVGGSPAEGDLVFFRIYRDVSDANDDMTEDARLIGVEIFYTTDAETDA